MDVSMSKPVENFYKSLLEPELMIGLRIKISNIFRRDTGIWERGLIISSVSKVCESRCTRTMTGLA